MSFVHRESRTSETVTLTRSVNRLSSSLHSTTDLELDSFQILPKTDYTYARSGSYSSRHLDEKYTAPNMSRHGIRAIATFPGLPVQDSDLDLHTARKRIHQGEVNTPGMLLRSGVRLKEKMQLMEEVERRRSLRDNLQVDEVGTSSQKSALWQQATTSQYGHEFSNNNSSDISPIITRSYTMDEDSADDSTDFPDSSPAGSEAGSQFSSTSAVDSVRNTGLVSSKNEDRWLSGIPEEGVVLKYLYGLDSPADSSEDLDPEYTRMMSLPSRKEYSYTVAEEVTPQF